jgi:hypothetical protein
MLPLDADNCPGIVGQDSMALIPAMQLRLGAKMEEASLCSRCQILREKTGQSWLVSRGSAPQQIALKQKQSSISNPARQPWRSDYPRLDGWESVLYVKIS